jgi:hypothetical protein
MDLLEFARGPALQFAAYIFVAGTLWRIVGVLLLKGKPEFSEPRARGGWLGALKVIYTRAFTAEPFMKATLYPKIVGYVMHIGLFATVFLFTPHIVFFEGWTGLDWPGLPNSMIFIIGVATVVSGIALIVRRVTNPVLKLIDSRAIGLSVRDIAGHTHAQRRTPAHMATIRQVGTHIPRFYYPRYDRHGV